jgi:hypothetical protein
MPPRSRQVGAILSLEKGDQRHHAVLKRHRRTLYMDAEGHAEIAQPAICVSPSGAA